MGVITRSDYHEMLRFGIFAARDGSEQAIETAAEYLLLTVDPDERRSLRTEFHEGVRNYARDQGDIEGIMTLLDSTMEELEVENK